MSGEQISIGSHFPQPGDIMLFGRTTDGKGDVTSSHVVWKTNKSVGHKPSPGLVPNAGHFPTAEKDPFLTIGPLARTLVDNGVPEGEFEDDLFAGLRTGAVDRA